MNRIIKLCILFVLCVVLFLTLSPSIVLADTALPDDDPVLYNINVNRHLYETDDFFLYGRYYIPYETQPDEGVDETYIFNLIDTDGTTVLGSYYAYPYWEGGYNYGIFAFYFSSTDAPDWSPIAGSYTIEIRGTPSAFETPPSYLFDVPSSAYSTQTTQANNQTEVYNNMIVIARSLQGAWGFPLLSEQDEGTVLSSYGEEYFRGAVLGMQIICPQLFFLQIIQIDTATRSWGTTQDDYYKAMMNGTWVKDSLDNFADEINIPTMLLIGIIGFGASAFVIYKSVQKYQTPWAGYMGAFLIFMCIGMIYQGLLYVALIVFFTVMAALFFLVFKRA